METPISKATARKQLGWGKTKMSAVCGALGIRSRSVMLSTLSKFVEGNPGFVTNSIYHGRDPKIVVKWKGKRCHLSVLHHPEIAASGKDLATAAAEIAPLVEKEFHKAA